MHCLIIEAVRYAADKITATVARAVGTALKQAGKEAEKVAKEAEKAVKEGLQKALAPLYGFITFYGKVDVQYRDANLDLTFEFSVSVGGQSFGPISIYFSLVMKNSNVFKIIQQFLFNEDLKKIFKAALKSILHTMGLVNQI